MFLNRAADVYATGPFSEFLGSMVTYHQMRHEKPSSMHHSRETLISLQYQLLVMSLKSDQS